MKILVNNTYRIYNPIHPWHGKPATIIEYGDTFCKVNIKLTGSIKKATIPTKWLREPYDDI